MAFGDAVQWADNTAEVETAKALLPSPVPTVGQFPPVMFDATLVPPYNAEDEARAAEAEQMRLLEDDASGLPQEVIDSERTLHEIVKNKFMSEATRVRAAQLILARYDMKTEVAALYARLEALESAKAEAANDGELPPHLRRK